MAAQPATTQTHFGIGQISKMNLVKIFTELSKLVECFHKINTGFSGNFTITSCPEDKETPHAIEEFMLGEIQRLFGILVNIFKDITFTWVELPEMSPIEKLAKWKEFREKYTAYQEASGSIQKIIRLLPFGIRPKQDVVVTAFEEHLKIDLVTAQDALIRINENCNINVAIIELFMVFFRDKIETESVRDAHSVGFRAAVETLKVEMLKQ